jgi:predicted regulator of Ras-like GTPase activity (Roadblock/LC7/MglB family)
MVTIPPLVEEDVEQLGAALQELLTKSDATTAMVIDKAGFLIAKAGHLRQFDLTTIAALASGAYAANQTIASLVRERNFSSIYQQGDKYSMLVMNVDEHCLLVAIFQAAVGVGIVKYFAASTCTRIAEQMKAAQKREPAAGFDLSAINLADASGVFKRKS